MRAASKSGRASICAVFIAAIACVAVGTSGAGAAGRGPVTTPLILGLGIADQKWAVFDDPQLQALGLRYARRSVAWDALDSPDEVEQIDAWMEGVRAMGAEPLFTIARSRARPGFKARPPDPAQYLRQFKRLRERYPDVRTFSAWNEANLCGAGTCRRPELVARYYDAVRRNCRGCTVLAADLVDVPKMAGWARAFGRALKVQPRYWGLHNYLDVNRMQTFRTQSLLRAVKGEVWLTEVGGIVARRNGSLVAIPEGEVHAATAMRFLFDSVVRLSPRITRVYVYHWRATTSEDSWDSALLDADGVPRSAFSVFESVVHEAG